MKRIPSIFSIMLMVSLALPLLGRGQWVQTNGPHHQVFTYGGYTFSPVVLGNKLLCLTASGVLRSTDSGTSWTVANTGLTAQPNVLVAIGNQLYLGCNRGLFVSRDTGVSWQEINIHSPEPDVDAITRSGENLVVGSILDSVFLSRDGGQNWEAVFPLTVMCFDSIGALLFAAVDVGGIYCSSDHGVNWQHVSPTRWATRAFRIGSGNLLLSTDTGFFRSSDSGHTWEPANRGLPSGVVYALASAGTMLYSSPYGHGLYVSSDTGADWRSAGDTGLATSNISDILPDGGNLYIGSVDGLFHSTDHGTHWTVHNPQSTVCADVHRLDSADGKLYASTANGVFVTSDSGGRWSQDTDGMGDVSITAVAAVDGMLFAGSSSKGVFVSEDSGRHWNALDTGRFPAPDIATIAASDGTLYVASQSGVFLSTDDGVSWRNPHHAPYGAISVAHVGDHLIAGTSLGTLYYSLDSGTTWQTSLTSPISANSQVLVVDSGIVYAGTAGEGLWQSTDSGVTWEAPADPPVNWNITALTCADGLLFAGTSNGAIYSSKDRGVLWTYSGSGFPNGIAVQSFVVLNGYLYAGTSDSGIWRLALPSGSPASIVLPLSKEANLTAYPNPSTQSTTLHFTAAMGGYATITVVNALGAEVARLYSGELSAGEHPFTWDAARMAAPRGMYECVVRLDGRVQEVPIVLE